MTASHDELTGAAQTFLAHFLGEENWSLWASLREYHGFASNRDFTRWLLSLAERQTNNSRLLNNPLYHQNIGLDLKISSCSILEGDPIPPPPEDGNFAEVLSIPEPFSVPRSVESRGDNSQLFPQLIQSLAMNITTPDAGVKKWRQPIYSANQDGSRKKNSGSNHQQHDMLGLDLALKKQENGKNLEEFSCSFCLLKFETEEMLSEHEYLTHSGKGEGDLRDLVAEEREFVASFTGVGIDGDRPRNKRKMSKGKRVVDVDALSEGGSSTGGDWQASSSKAYCEYCKQTLSSRNNLRRHILSVHWQLKNYNCHECGKSFARSDHLKQHKCPALSGDGSSTGAASPSAVSPPDSILSTESFNNMMLPMEI